MPLINFSRSKIFTGVSLIALGVLSRFVLAEYVGVPNFEAITAITLISAVFLGGVWTFVVPLSILAIKDVIMGNNPVLFFTWSAFAVIGLFGMLSRSVILSGAQQGGVEESRGIISKYPFLLSLRESAYWRRRSKPVAISKNTGLPRSFQSPAYRTGRLAMTAIGMTIIGIGSSIFFFLYTNFGWWLVTNMYPHTLDGLIQAYIMGLPFFKNNLIGNLFFVPVFSSAAMFVKFGVKNKIWNQKKAFLLDKS